MPGIQKRYEKHCSTDELRVLTINNDDSPHAVRKWMKRRNYTFPVLLDGGYLRKNVVHASPTTWTTTMDSLDVVHQLEGCTGSFVERFSWRM